METVSSEVVQNALLVGCVMFDNRPEAVHLNGYDFEYFEHPGRGVTPILGATEDRKTLGAADVEAMEMQLRMNGCEGRSLLVLPAGSGISFGLAGIDEIYSAELTEGTWRGHAILISGAGPDLEDTNLGMNIAVAKNFMIQ